MKRIIQILTIYLVLLPVCLNAQKSKDIYSPSSVLSSGKWFKIAVTKDGIYRINYSKLTQLGLVNPSNPKIFCNNPGQLSYYNNDPKPDDLKETAIYTSKGSDGIFNEGDYLLFFGKGTGRWIFNKSTKNYDYLRHNYSDTAFYFITSDATPGKRVGTLAEPAQAANNSSAESDALFIHEQEVLNMIKSGREWYQPISTAAGILINPGFTDLIPGEMIKYDIRVAARASVSTQLRLYEGTTSRKSLQVQGLNIFLTTGTYANIVDSSGLMPAGSVSPVYEMRFYNNGETLAEGYIDYVKLQARKTNVLSGSSMIFSDSRSVAPGKVTEFSIRYNQNDALIWDVTDPINPKQVMYNRSGDNLTFKTSTDSLKSFLAFTTAGPITPQIRSSAVPNQNLHNSGSADMIIITHPMFLTYAQKIADIHFANSGLISQIITTDQVYNEFSGGIPDIAALRNFVRMKYMKQLGSNHPLKYLLLFGDGSYENKTLPPGNPNFIPTYQSQNSTVVVSSFTSDDFYTLLEDGEGEADGTEDIGVGRLPVSDTVQAGIMISKIRRYLDPANMGDWRNIITLTADDEDGNTHMSDAEGLAALLRDSVPSFNVEKIYLDAFRQTTSANGQSYPDVNKAITDRINAGCLIFNYTGHGNENSLAAEGVIKTENINSWKNGNKLALFITATCEFSRFDNILMNVGTREMTGVPSAGEIVLMNKDGGAIALMSTTRIVYSAPNYFLNRNIFNFAFDKDKDGNALRLGDIMRLAKNNSGNGPNKRNFSLLGDPALRLSYPWHGRVVTDSINNVSVTNNIDSLKALSMMTISGHIEDQKGIFLNNFEGIVSPIVYDKESRIRTLANDGGQTMEFNLRNNILFSGKTMAKDGKFRFTFIVPRDIDYSLGYGKISYYANNVKDDMSGNFNRIVVGGFSKNAITDTEGPDIRLFINDTLFRNGGITDNNPKLLAIIEDKGGINTTGSGIGHDLTGYLDNDPNRSFLLNSYFENDFDNYKKGKLIYDMPGLSSGSHTLTLKAWDNYNNSSVKSILFLVDTNNGFVLRNLFNYPNPFPVETTISAEHNRPDSELNVIINVFNLSGMIIKTINTTVTSGGYALPPIKWDGNDNGGKRVGKGMYPYTVIITTNKGETARTSGRMIIL